MEKRFLQLRQSEGSHKDTDISGVLNCATQACDVEANAALATEASSHESAPEKADIDAIAAGTNLTMRQFLRKGAKAEHAGDLGAEVMDNMEQAQQNLKTAIRAVKKFGGHLLKVNLDNIFIGNLPGDLKGISRVEKTIIDPTELLHPCGRLVMLLLHELAHSNDTVQHESLVEYWAQQIGHKIDGTSPLESSHSEWLPKFEAFIEKFDKKGNDEKAATKVIKMYKKLDGRGIFKMYYKNFVRKQAPDQRSAAVAEFKLHFPEFGRFVVEEENFFGRPKFSFDQEGFEAGLQMASDGKLRVNTEGMHDHMVAKPKPVQKAGPVHAGPIEGSDASDAEMNALVEAAETTPRRTPMKPPGTNPTAENPWG
jgi:hypothetical protein